MSKITNGVCKMDTQNGHRKFLLDNPYLQDPEADVLFHLKMCKKTHDFKTLFGDVKFVCIGGTARRMKECANFITKELGLPLPKNNELEDLTVHGHRFSMFKAGCVLCVNHGMGYSSIMILLHEVIKLLHYAEVENPIIFRVGTCGGIQVPNGTVVISNEVVNDFFEPICYVPVLGKIEKRPCVVNQKLANTLKKISEQRINFPVTVGKIMSNEHFYESMAAKCATICEHTDEERDEYLRQLQKNNVLCLDMEAVVLSSLTYKLGIKSAVVNVAVNGCVSDKAEPPTAADLVDWESRPYKVVVEFIKYCLRNPNEVDLNNGDCS